MDEVDNATLAERLLGIARNMESANDKVRRDQHTRGDIREAARRLALTPIPAEASLTTARADGIEVERLREWRPIETAPRDGTLILLAGDPQGPPEAIVIGCNRNDIVTPGCFDTACFGNWWPTHWQPLPSFTPTPANEPAKDETEVTG